MPLAPSSRARLQASLALAGTLALWWWRRGPIPAGIAGAAAALAMVAWFSPRHYAPVQRALDAIVHGALAALTWALLGAIYFGILAPLRLWRDLRRHDPLQRRRDVRRSTYLQPLPPGPSRFDRQF